jgi:hypothetical protein
MSLSPLEAVEILSQKFLMQEGISGVGLSHKSLKIRIYVESEEYIPLIPERVLGYDVEIIVTGRLYALGSLGRSLLTYQSGDKKARWRPIPGGVSISTNIGGTGTYSVRVFDKSTGEILMLSNRHVFVGDLGTPVIQPGSVDGGKYPDDVVGYVHRYVPVNPPPAENLVDAALAKPVSKDVLSNEILDVGVVSSHTSAYVNMVVVKSGRNCLSTSKVIDVNAVVKVYGYDEGYAIFKDQILVQPALGQPGDSGSLVVDVSSKKAVGLLFAGSDTVTAVNKIENVLNLLNISLSPPSVTVPSPPLPLLSLAGVVGTMLFVAMIPVSSELSKKRF